MPCIPQIGDTCVGAKINGRLLPLRTQLQQRRPGRDRHLEGADPVADLGALCRHRQGARPHPPLYPHPAARAISRSRPRHRAEGVPPGGPGFLRTAARSGADAVQLRHGRGSLRRGRRGAGDRPRGGQRRLPAAARGQETRSCRSAAARGARHRATTRRCRSAGSSRAWRCISPAAATRCRATASSASSRPARASRSTRSIATRSEASPTSRNAGSTSPGAATRPRRSHVGRINVTIANEPGNLGSLTTTIGKQGGNITNLKITNRSTDFFEIMVDIEVADVKHLSTIIAALRATPVINSVERARG